MRSESSTTCQMQYSWLYRSSKQLESVAMAATGSLLLVDDPAQGVGQRSAWEQFVPARNVLLAMASAALAVTPVIAARLVVAGQSAESKPRCPGSSA